MELRIVALTVTPFRQNCRILFDQDRRSGVVIDPGGEVTHIMDSILDHGIEIENIVLTHGHLDHAGGAADLAGQLGVKILGPHLADRFLLQSLEDQGRQFCLDGLRNCDSDLFLDEGDTLTLAGVPFDVLHCPGHTPGHVVFVCEEAHLAIVGDVIFHGAVGRTDFPYSDHQSLMRSIGTKLMRWDDEMKLLCGHGQDSTIGRERRENPFMAEVARFLDI